jgi:transglutaminase superfamily protein
MKRIVVVTGLLFTIAALGVLLRFLTLHRNGNSNGYRISYLDSNYEAPPEKADWAIPGDEDQALLGEILETVLDGKENSSDEDKSIRILKYVSSSLVQRANQGSATKIIRDGFALCGGKSHVFVILCRRAGMAARYVGSMYMPEMGSHAIGEVFYGGRWHMYDPTFGIFFYSSPDYDNKGYVISFHDLVSDPYRWTAFKAVPKPGEGRYDESAKAFALTKLESDYLDDDIGLASYRKNVSEAYPIAYGSDDLVSYPIDANLLETGSQWFGEVNGDDGELASYAVRFSGSHYVGNGVPPAFHTWLIKAAPYSTLSIEYYSVNANPSKLVIVPLRAAKVIETKYADKKVSFTIQTNDSSVIVSVYCPGTSFDVDAMHIYSW